jgi:hypothetical protein
MAYRILKSHIQCVFGPETCFAALQSRAKARDTQMNRRAHQLVRVMLTLHLPERVYVQNPGNLLRHADPAVLTGLLRCVHRKLRNKRLRKRMHSCSGA